MVETARNCSQSWWWRGDICFEVSLNACYAFEPKANNWVCASLHACALEPSWVTASALFKHLLGPSPLYFYRCFTHPDPTWSPAQWEHQYMFPQEISSAGILLGGRNHHHFILKWNELIYFITSFWEFSAKTTYLRIAFLWSVKDKALVSTLQTCWCNHST